MEQDERCASSGLPVADGKALHFFESQRGACHDGPPNEQVQAAAQMLRARSLQGPSPFFWPSDRASGQLILRYLQKYSTVVESLGQIG